MIVEPRCYERRCIHFLGVKGRDGREGQKVVCAAFPEGIPEDIAYGPNLHLNPIEGDGGIVFEEGPPREVIEGDHLIEEDPEIYEQ